MGRGVVDDTDEGVRGMPTPVDADASTRLGGPPDPAVVVPRQRPGHVRRLRLLRRLRGQGARRITSVVAPPGYGKTSLLVQLATGSRGAVAWLTVDRPGDDPVSFLRQLAAALAQCESIDAEMALIADRPLASTRAMIGRLLGILAAHPDPVLIVIDDAHRLTGETTLDALTAFIDHLPADCRIALAARGVPGLPVARWLADGLVEELGPDALAMDEEEIAALLRHHGLAATPEVTRRLLEQTEGWPALLALAALHAARSDGQVAPQVSARDLPIADYLRSELLARLTPDQWTFLTRTSILERLDGDVCDALLERTGSAELLATLARSMLLVDDYGGSYRYHHLLRELLRHELRSREPGLIPALHLRAAACLEASGAADLAVEHAFASGDLDAAAAIVGRVSRGYHWTGRRATVRTWIRRFSDEELVRQPWLAVLAALHELGYGDTAALEHYADIAERGSYDGLPQDGTASFESARTILRASMARRGIDDMRRNAELAVELEAPGSRWRDYALWLLALARQAEGDVPGADSVLSEAVATARANGNEVLAYCVAGHRAVLAIERQDWATAGSLLGLVAGSAGAGEFDGYPSTGLALAAQARVAVHAGDVARARALLARATALRPMLTTNVPVHFVITILALARAHLAISDTPGARTLLAQARHILRVRPDLGVLVDEVAAMQETIGKQPPTLAWGASSLTATELRVLALLPYYLSFKEIGQRLGIKATTVKTHAVSIYGKLGASTRSEAVDLATEAGLLERLPV